MALSKEAPEFDIDDEVLLMETRSEERRVGKECV